MRYGDNKERTILRDFIDSDNPETNPVPGVYIKKLYNLYVYFWRWALWKVYERDIAQGPGIVSFISGSSYIDGDSFCVKREHFRRQCDEI